MRAYTAALYWFSLASHLMVTKWPLQKEEGGERDNTTDSCSFPLARTDHMATPCSK